ncbi:hypothetical protein Tco_1017066 [Tanacetum coccineum]|uniref:Uncharacterized protein n=1 Tax=Tanacetum coccineum TaxID=301880 RepID=A0ABQ5FQG1_9ASTR
MDCVSHHVEDGQGEKRSRHTGDMVVWSVLESRGSGEDHIQRGGEGFRPLWYSRHESDRSSGVGEGVGSGGEVEENLFVEMDRVEEFGGIDL